MSLRVTDFNTLTQDLQSVFYETAETKIAESTGMKLFDVKSTELKDYKHQLLHGVAGITKVPEASDFPRVSSEEGDNITYTQAKYGVNVPVTWENRSYWREENGNVFRLVQSVTDEAFDKIDQSMADVLLQGWGTSYTDVYDETVASVGPDGLALFSASHTNGTTSTTYKNIMNDGTNDNPSLSREAIVAERATGLQYTDPNGLTRPIRLDTIIVGPDLEDQAMRIVESSQMSGTANNDINPLKGIKVVVWDRLGAAADGTDTSAYWFMADSRKLNETLKAIFKKRPSLDLPDEVYANANWEYRLFYSYVLGRGFAPYLRGSKGTNT